MEIIWTEGEIDRGYGSKEEVKRSLLDQFRLLEERYSDQPGHTSPSLQWLIVPALLSASSK
jgi:hypothetical protein